MEKLKKDRSRRKLSEYGKIISEDVWIEKMLLEECLDAQKNVRAVEKLVELKRFSRDTQGYLCYLKIRNEEDVEEKWGFTINGVYFK